MEKGGFCAHVADDGHAGRGTQMPTGGMMHFHRGRISVVTPPLCNARIGKEPIRILNHYFSHMISGIQRDKGIIVDFLGDALLVFFDPMDGRIEHTSLEALH